MQPKVLFVVHAVVSLVFGLSLVLMPETLASFYGGTLNEAGNSLARSAIILGLFATLIIGGLVSLHFQLTGTVNAWGWTTVPLYFGVAALYGYVWSSASKV